MSLDYVAMVSLILSTFRRFANGRTNEVAVVLRAVDVVEIRVDVYPLILGVDHSPIVLHTQKAGQVGEVPFCGEAGVPGVCTRYRALRPSLEE